MSAEEDLSGLESQWNDVEKAVTDLEGYVPDAGKFEWDALTSERGVLDTRITELQTSLQKETAELEEARDMLENEKCDSVFFHEKLEEVAPAIRKLEQELSSTKNLHLAIHQIRALAERYEAAYPVEKPKKVDPMAGVGTTGTAA